MDSNLAARDQTHNLARLLITGSVVRVRAGEPNKSLNFKAFYSNFTDTPKSLWTSPNAVDAL